MNTIDTFLVQYGLFAVFLVMFVKSVGVPIPIPADLIILTTAARVAAGNFSPGLAFLSILFALVLGGHIQFILVRGPGRGLLYRYGRYLGLTPLRLDAAAVKVKKGGVPAISLAILVPGVRGAAIAASGLAGLPFSIFTPGLILGSTLFLSLHFFLGYLGGSLLTVIGRVVPLPELITLVLVLLGVAFALWIIAFRRQKEARVELNAATTEVWQEGVCPICLALYTANQLRVPLMSQGPLSL